MNVLNVKKERAVKFLGDNPILDRLIEVGTKALRCGLMSGETLRAPRQQLRRLRTSVFVLSSKFLNIARLPGANRISKHLSALLFRLGHSSPSQLIRKIVRAIQENLKSVVILSVEQRLA